MTFFGEKVNFTLTHSDYNAISFLHRLLFAVTVEALITLTSIITWLSGILDTSNENFVSNYLGASLRGPDHPRRSLFCCNKWMHVIPYLNNCDE